MTAHIQWWLRSASSIPAHPQILPYSGKLSREKTFANFAVLWLSVKVFSTKLGGVVSFGIAKASNPRKSYFSPIRESFLPRKFPAIRYNSWSTVQREGESATDRYPPADLEAQYRPIPLNISVRNKLQFGYSGRQVQVLPSFVTHSIWTVNWWRTCFLLLPHSPIIYDSTHTHNNCSLRKRNT